MVRRAAPPPPPAAQLTPDGTLARLMRLLPLRPPPVLQASLQPLFLAPTLQQLSLTPRPGFGTPLTLSPESAWPQLTNSPDCARSQMTNSPGSACSQLTNSPGSAYSQMTNSPGSACSQLTNSPGSACSQMTNSPGSACSQMTNSPDCGRSQRLGLSPAGEWAGSPPRAGQSCSSPAARRWSGPAGSRPPPTAAGCRGPRGSPALVRHLAAGPEPVSGAAAGAGSPDGAPLSGQQKSDLSFSVARILGPM